MILENTQIDTPADTTPARPPFRVRVEQAQTLLRERYPTLFAAADPKPLAIGIHRVLLEPTPPTPPESPPAAVPERPVLRLKKPAGPVVSAAVARKGGRP